MITRFYASEDMPLAATTWSVYSEQYADLLADPIDGTQRKVATFITRSDAEDYVQYRTLQETRKELTS